LNFYEQGRNFDEPVREMTYSDRCHEELVEALIAEFGEFKQVVRLSTGKAYRVPTRDIIERGLKEQELDNYPLWDETSDTKRRVG